MRKILPFLLLLLMGAQASAVDFSSISRRDPIAITYTAQERGYADILLEVDASESRAQTLYLRVRYVIGADTLNDYLKVDKVFKGLLKRILLNEDERMVAEIFLHNAEVEQVNNVKGAVVARLNPDQRPSTDLGMSTFISNLWVREQSPLFRVKFEEQEPRDFRIVFHFDGNYEFDNLFFKVKVISPEEGVLFLDRMVPVTDEKNLSLKPRTVRVELDGVNFSYPGSYYFQVTHTMAPDRLNGVSKVTYDVATAK